MPRVNNQDVPPKLAAAYNQTFGPTRPVAYPGNQHPSELESVQKHYPFQLEPPHVPTTKQMQERQYFQDVFTCFNAAPANERTAYWRLSRAGPLHYYNDYMRKNLIRRIQGETCPDWREPYARSFKSEHGGTYGHYLTGLLDTDEHILAVSLELDPITPGHYPAPWPIPDAPYSIIHFWFDWTEVMWKRDILATFDPSERSEYEEDYNLDEIPPGDPIDRQVRIIRYGATDSGEAVVWYSAIDGGPAEFEGFNFE